MAAPIDVSTLTLNAKESLDFQKFIFELAFNQSALSANHRVWTGLTMKEQIVFASLFGLSGIKDAGTSRPNSGGKPAFTQKYWEPEKVGDTMIFNQSELNGLFKAYFDKITKYSQNFEISGSDEEKFLATVFSESAINAINRLVWFGDKAVAAAVSTTATITGTTNSGLTVNAQVKGVSGNGISLEIKSVSAGAEAISVVGKVIEVSLTAAAKTIGDLKTLVEATPAATALVAIVGTAGTALSVEGAITTAGATDTAGLLAAANVKFFDSINGIFKKVKTEVGTGAIKRYTIAKNAELTKADQALGTDASLAIFEGVWALADSRLKADSRKVMMVSNSIFENYRQSLQTKGTPYNVSLTTDGFSELSWNGVSIRNMENIWDLNKSYFAEGEAGLADLEPHKVILTVPDNIPVGTLNDGDFANLEAFYDQITRQNYMAYGFTLDAQVLEGYMIVAAY
jgi:hypothetical protein